jgi:antitoxin component of RelBE/YafQ-DinJ toxin-antitoxin module
MEAQTKRKAMTLRIDTDTAEQLEAVAQVEGLPVSEVIREALARYIVDRRGDADFQKRLHDSIERNKTILERLSR